MADITNRAGKPNLALQSMIKAAPQAQTDANIRIDVDKLDEYHDEYGDTNSLVFGTADEDSETVQALVESIKRDGFNGAIQVVKADTPGRYMIIEGHQRLAALKILGETTVPCHVLKIDAEAARAFWIDSNIVRRNFGAYRYALVVQAFDKEYDRLKKEGRKPAGGRDQYVSSRLFGGKTSGTSMVKRYRSILSFPESVAKRCENQEFPYTVLLSAKDFKSDDMELLDAALKDYDKKHSGEVITADELRKTIDKIRKRGQEYGDSDPLDKVTGHTGKNGKEAQNFAKKQQEEYRQYYEQFLSGAKKAVIVDEPLQVEVDAICGLLNGSKFEVGNKAAVNRAIYGLEAAVKELKKKAGY